ncbi:MAG: hypothetical protein ABII18_00310 [bacterium]|nr:hypothetical protein [bacterium]MBU1916558.1 hypothetical protein [bacterium]
MNIDQEILVNILALDKGFEDFEFVHSYLGPEDIKKYAEQIPVKKAYLRLKELKNHVADCFTDEFPYYRQTYIQDYIDSILAQTELFVFNQEPKYFKSFVERLLGMQTFPQFDLDQELNEAVQIVKQQGFQSIKDYQSRRQEIRFQHDYQLKTCVRQIMKEQTDKVIRNTEHLFDFPVADLLKQSKLRIEASKPVDPPCYYYYRGQFNGTVGLQMKKKYHKDYLTNFLAHEVLPGHHFYYLIKEHYLKSRNTDLLMSIDTFYSPENLINEGLAVNSDLLLDENNDPYVVSMLCLEKLLHKIYHNAWYQVNIEKQSISPEIENIVCHEIGLKDAQMRLEYFTQEAKYYTPSYSHGIYYVENIIKKCGKRVISFLYGQHSVNTLGKLGAHYDRLS